MRPVKRHRSPCDNTVLDDKDGYNNDTTDESTRSKSKKVCPESSRTTQPLVHVNHSTNHDDTGSPTSTTPKDHSANAADEGNEPSDVDTASSGTSPSIVAPANDITFNQAFDDFNIHPDERRELIVEYKKLMACFQSPELDVQGLKKNTG